MSQDPKEMLEEHGEKAALGIALAVAAYVFLTTGGGKALEIKTEMDTAISQVKKNLNSSLPESELPPVMGSKGPYQKIREPWAPLTGTMPDDLPWTYYIKPKIVIKSQVGPDPHLLSKVGEMRVSVDRRKISVSWGSAPTSVKNKDGQTRYNRKSYPAKILKGRVFDAFLGYVVEKWQAGRTEKTYRVFESRNDTRFDDTAFEPETTYKYRVRAFWLPEYKIDESNPRIVAESPKLDIGNAKVETFDVKGYEGKFKGQKVAFTEWSNVAQGTTSRNIVVRFHNRSMTQARFGIWQFWRGDWWRVVLKLEPGEDVGGMVSPKQLLTDDYNKQNHGSSEAFQALQKEAKPDEKSIRWRSGFVYIGVKKVTKKGEVAILEHHEVRMRGAFGLDWGLRTVDIERSSTEEQKAKPN